ncbi:hypothetical protein SAMN04487995_5299 [Dyadobacter koreensis]|uniref:Uncharacterized protein n=1 Tax=Dyadobacter koreensis TaxID=408657 RepID=A0A1H7A2J2_9BACT|nr:hypothetical protein [Dyadobacter koreensis]SEJ56080.1 hypothetical protein SAMN04487995_5299 [Dyadobacter koreensis]
MADQAITSKQVFSKAMLAVKVRPTVTKAQINEILERIYKENGCTGCGLGGRDLLINIDDILVDHERFSKALKLDSVVDFKILNSLDTSLPQR